MVRAIFPLFLMMLYFSACTSTSEIKYPWLTHLYGNRMRSMRFVPDSYFTKNTFDDPTFQVNAVFDDDRKNFEIGRPSFNSYQLAMKKYWALLNPYVPMQEKVKKMFPHSTKNAVSDDEPFESNDAQYAQLDTPEYQPDEPILELKSLRKIKNDETK